MISCEGNLISPDDWKNNIETATSTDQNELDSRKDVNNLALDILRMYEKNLHHDVVLVISKGLSENTGNDAETLLPAHRAILAARSPVFASYFAYPTREAQDGRITITDMSVEVAEILLRFLYSGSLQIAEPLIIESLLIAADKYQVIELKNLCENILLENMSLSNACDLLLLADMYSERLKKAAFHFIDR